MEGWICGRSKFGLLLALGQPEKAHIVRHQRAVHTVHKRPIVVPSPKVSHSYSTACHAAPNHPTTTTTTTIIAAAVANTTTAAVANTTPAAAKRNWCGASPTDICPGHSNSKLRFLPVIEQHNRLIPIGKVPDPHLPTISAVSDSVTSSV
jgi:hypothetical protein